MELTGKAENDFEEWFIKSEHNTLIFETKSRVEFKVWDYWDDVFSDSMKWGVLVDYFDSVGIHIVICKTNATKRYTADIGVILTTNQMKWEGFKKSFITRSEARIKAIKKAIEIFNSQQ